jgi:hypothetical protein
VRQRLFFEQVREPNLGVSEEGGADVAAQHVWIDVDLLKEAPGSISSPLVA